MTFTEEQLTLKPPTKKELENARYKLFGEINLIKINSDQTNLNKLISWQVLWERFDPKKHLGE